jgi:hypothetical protein
MNKIEVGHLFDKEHAYDPLRFDILTIGNG